MEYRLDKKAFLEVLENWNRFLKRKVHLIACGGTALTLLDIKPSTKDIDFIVPVVREYNYLIGILKDLGYKQSTGSGWQKAGDVFIFDMFPGKRIHTTELLESPLKEGNHILLQEFSHLYIGILNEYDLIVSKLFRGASVDLEDCMTLVKARKGEIDIKRVEQHFKELAKYDISEKRIAGNLEHFLDMIRKEKHNG